MSRYEQAYAQFPSRSASRLDERAAFVVKTYNYLFGAILLFAAIEVALFASGTAEAIAQTLGGNWLLVLGGLMVVSWLASHVAHTHPSTGLQFAALGGFVVAEAIVFVPLLVMAEIVAPGALKSAALVTFVGFAGLTAVVFVSRKDFSFLRTFLKWGGIMALVLIAMGLVFGFSLGTFFSVAMVGFAGAAILYDTSAVLRDFPTDRPVAAALQLFSSVMLLLWYVIRLFMVSRD